MSDGVSWVETALLIVIVVLIVLPPRLDPAIRLKERQERRRLEREARHD